MNLTRRNLLKNISIGAAAFPLIGLTTSCSANAATILNEIDLTLSDAEAVIAATESVTSLTAPIFGAINTWLSLVKAATDQALVIDNGAAKLTAVQVAGIVELYSQAVVFNIPGLPVVIDVAIKAAIAAINTLLSLLKGAVASGAISQNSLVVLTPGGRLKHFLVKRHAAAFSGHITKMNTMMAGHLI